MIQESTSNQAELIDILSNLIKTFKKILATIENISNLMAKEQSYLSQLGQLLEVINQNEQILQKVDYRLPHNFNVESSFTRFHNRLTELLLGTSKSPLIYNGSDLICKFLSKAQESLKLLKISRNLSKAFSQIFSLTKIFCRATQGLLNGDPIQYDGVFYEKPKQIKTKKIINPEYITPDYQIPKKQSHYTKVLNIFTSYYSCINCLDLDYPAFKSLYFQTRSQSQQELISQETERNVSIVKAITVYSKHFNDYLKRKQRLLIRKNKLSSFDKTTKPIYHNKNSTTSHQQVMSLQKDKQCEVISQQDNFVYNFERDKTLKEQIDPAKMSHMPSFTYQNQRKKCNYHIKNVLITFGKYSGKQSSKQPKANQSDYDYIYHRQYQPPSFNKSYGREIKTREKHKKLSPVRLNPAQLNFKGQFLMKELQEEKTYPFNLEKKINIIHKHNWTKKKNNQLKTIRVSSFARRLPNELRFIGKKEFFEQQKKLGLESQTIC